MTLRTDRAHMLQEETEAVESNVTSSLYAPWQTLSALATETSQAVRETFTDSGVDTRGHVQQGLHRHVPQSVQERTTPASQPETFEVLANDQDNGQVWKHASTAQPDHITHEAVQADISRVTTKIMSADAATEVVLRFNFLSGKEAKVL